MHIDLLIVNLLVLECVLCTYLPSICPKKSQNASDNVIITQIIDESAGEYPKNGSTIVCQKPKSMNSTSHTIKWYSSDSVAVDQKYLKCLNDYCSLTSASLNDSYVGAYTCIIFDENENCSLSRRQFDWNSDVLRVLDKKLYSTSLEGNITVTWKFSIQHSEFALLETFQTRVINSGKDVDQSFYLSKVRSSNPFTIIYEATKYDVSNQGTRCCSLQIYNENMEVDLPLYFEGKTPYIRSWCNESEHHEKSINEGRGKRNKHNYSRFKCDRVRILCGFKDRHLNMTTMDLKYATCNQNVNGSECEKKKWSAPNNAIPEENAITLEDVIQLEVNVNAICNVTIEGVSFLKSKSICVDAFATELKATEENGERINIYCELDVRCNSFKTIKWFRQNLTALRKEPIFNSPPYKIFNENERTTTLSSTLNAPSTRNAKYICIAEDECNCQRLIGTWQNLNYDNSYYVAGITASSLISIICLVGLIYLMRRNRRNCRDDKNLVYLNLLKGDVASINENLPINEQASILPFEPKWEFPAEKLKLGKIIGSGYFGTVFSAEAYGIVDGEKKTKVAVKMAQGNADPQTVLLLAEELKIMCYLGRHIHIVNLLGAVVNNIAEQGLMIIVEICPFGNLSNYLAENRHRFAQKGPKSLPNVKNPNAKTVSNKYDEKCGTNSAKLDYSLLTLWSFQIARGMQWLASKRVVHGDLAARNVLLAREDLVKICDFGLAKHLYSEYVRNEKKDKVKLPVMWMAMESVQYRKFSTKSDVWSFGITLWEIFSLGAVPYSTFQSFHELWKHLCDGYRMEKPLLASENIHQLMLKSWNADPLLRPSFTQLSQEIHDLLDTEVREKYAKEEFKFDSKEKLSPKYDSKELLLSANAYNDLDGYQDVLSERYSFQKPYGFINVKCESVELRELSNSKDQH